MNETAIASQSNVGERMSFRRWAATSQNGLARWLRRIHRGIHSFSVPAPRILVLPALWLFIAMRKTFYFFWRVFVCEPLFKAYCTSYGRNLHTETKIHWIQGKGDIVLGDNVIFGGKIGINFAARFANRPRLEVGDNTEIGNGCTFAIGKMISIGKNCLLSGNISVMDSNAHVVDLGGRVARRPPPAEEVRPVRIGDYVWIARDCIIFPGVRIGEGSVISAGSVVRNHVPPYSVVAGNPAKVMFRTKPPAGPQQPA